MHTDYRCRDSIHPDGLTDYTRVAAVSPHPECIAENHHRRGALLVLIGAKVAAESWCSAQDTEPVRSDSSTAGRLGRPDAVSDSKLRGLEKRYSGKASRFGTPVEVIRVRDADRWYAFGEVAGADMHDPVPVRRWKRFQQNIVDEREHRCIRADANREYPDDDGSEPWRFLERAKCKSNIL